MSLAFVGSLVLVTVGTMVAGHTLVRWARHTGEAGDLAASLAVALGTVAAGLGLQGGDAVSAAVVLGALTLIVVGLLALARRRGRSLP